MRAKITTRTIKALPEGGVVFDTELRGFCARRLPSGRVSYGLKYFDAETGRQRWLALGLHGDALPPEKARRKAEIERGRVADGKDPQSEREAKRRNRGEIRNVNALLDAHLEQYVDARKLRSEHEIRRCFDTYVRPELGTTALPKLKRGHVVALMDKIATENGPVMADRVLAHLRSAMNWYATRDENFTVPLVRGMARTSVRERARDRTLSDDEIRALWQATEAEKPDSFATLVRVLLLSGQRRNEVAGMRAAEIHDNTWTVPADRAKNGRPNDVPLPAIAYQEIGRLPLTGDHVFGKRGNKPFSGFSKAKRELDEVMRKALRTNAPAAKWKPWVLHDLRRTARSLLSRVGVSADIAERLLNHAIPGVRGVYDRHKYIEEKREALVRLAALIERIVNPDLNVIDLAGRR